MNRDLTAEEIERYADGELDAGAAAEAETHLSECARCATAVLSVMQMKRALRAMPRFTPPAALRARVLARPARRPQAAWWLAAAAVVALAVAGGVFLRARDATAGQLVDLHTTILASANPVDVLSTDRHTVKPWFEGKLPFAVDVPDLPAPLHLIGGRVIYWHGQPGGYLLVGKGAHRISLFVFADDAVPRSIASRAGMTIVMWRARGLAYVAVADVPAEDLQPLQRAFVRE
ncbi:MAG TPA: zf-HC2 domain-containing protein [Thermoanaerobaculia bacterium]|jgi:anti-sigma factor RsiW|nr:zf-HC2 domain-containing protein [Thermoanaerobaculia bacterium]